MHRTENTVCDTFSTAYDFDKTCMYIYVIKIKTHVHKRTPRGGNSLLKSKTVRRKIFLSDNQASIYMWL